MYSTTKECHVCGSTNLVRLTSLDVKVCVNHEEMKVIPWKLADNQKSLYTGEDHSILEDSYLELKETKGNKMVVCSCTSLTEFDIRKALDTGLLDVDNIVAFIEEETGVTLECRTCVPLIEDISESYIDSIE